PGREPPIGIGGRYSDRLGPEIEADERAARRQQCGRFDQIQNGGRHRWGLACTTVRANAVDPAAGRSMFPAGRWSFPAYGTCCMQITWYGHSAFPLDFAGKAVLIDPFFTGNPAFVSDKAGATDGVTTL